MNRRGFLTTLAAGLVAPDPEKLLWVPGRKLISIPRPGNHCRDQVTMEMLQHIQMFNWVRDHPDAINLIVPPGHPGLIYSPSTGEYCPGRSPRIRDLRVRAIILG